MGWGLPVVVVVVVVVVVWSGLVVVVGTRTRVTVACIELIVFAGYTTSSLRRRRRFETVLLRGTCGEIKLWFVPLVLEVVVECYGVTSMAVLERAVDGRCVSWVSL